MTIEEVRVADEKIRQIDELDKYLGKLDGNSGELYVTNGKEEKLFILPTDRIRNVILDMQTEVIQWLVDHGVNNQAWIGRV